MSAPASSPSSATPTASSNTSKIRPLPGSIDLPPEKKQRRSTSDDEPQNGNGSNGNGSGAAMDDSDDAGAGGGVKTPVSIPSGAHNTPSPSFFMSLQQSHVMGRVTTNPSHIQRPPYLTRVRHAKQLVLITSDKKHDKRPYKTGKEMDVIELIEDGGMVIGHDGMIVAVGTDAEIAAKYDTPSAASSSSTSSASTLAPPTSTHSHAYIYELDATDTCILPGLVDGHTHPVWAGDRVHEFALKLAGATYMDIHKAGGGIGYTVQHTRAATEEALLASLLQRLDRALKLGTTLLEAKSGYGLELETELKMLKVIQRAHERHPIDLVANYCGAHSVPKGSTADEATKDVVLKQLPEIMKAKKTDNLTTLEMIDVFCEKGVFELNDTRTILKAGMDAGLQINFHGDELSPIHAAELGAELQATAISHLEHISEAGMRQMAAQGVVGTLLPGTAYILRIKPPPAKRMIELGVPVALGSDYNPNMHCISMPFAMNLACVYMAMTLPQALNAATINAAGSLNRAHEYGSLSAGKCGDFIMLEAPMWEHLIYQLVDPPITQVWKKGKLVWRERDGRVKLVEQ